MKNLIKRLLLRLKAPSPRAARIDTLLEFGNGNFKEPFRTLNKDGLIMFYSHEKGWRRDV